MVVVLEKLGVDGVGGARLESIVEKQLSGGNTLCKNRRGGCKYECHLCGERNTGSLEWLSSLEYLIQKKLIWVD